ncbi:MAG: YhfL family protein [Mixta sp.]
MKKTMKFAILAAVLATLTGCTGSVYNKEKNCDYDYLLHPAISISKIIGGCGPVAK